MRRASLAVGAALAVAVMGSAGEAAAQNSDGFLFAFCWSSPRDEWGYGTNERAVITELFRFEFADGWGQRMAGFKQAWADHVRSTAQVDGTPNSNCMAYTDLIKARQQQAGQEQFYRQGRLSVRTIAWRPEGTAAP